MSMKKMLIAMIALTVSLGSTGFAAAGSGRGGSHTGGGGFALGHGAVNRSMSDRAHDPRVSRNQSQLRHREETRSEGSAAADQRHAQGRGTGGFHGSAALDDTAVRPVGPNE